MLQRPNPPPTSDLEGVTLLKETLIQNKARGTGAGQQQAALEFEYLSCIRLHDPKGRE